MKNHLFTGVLVVLTTLFMTGKPTLAEPYGADIVIPTIIENSLNQNRTLDGEHGREVQKIIDYYNGKITIRVMAPAHAYQAFYDGKFACVTPDSRHYYDDGAPYIDSDALTSTNWVVVQHQGDKPILAASDLKGKIVGTFYPPEEIASIVPQKDVKYDVYADIKKNLMKVAMKRIDLAVLPHRGVADMIANSEELSGLTITASPPLATAYEGVMCHDSPRGHEVIKLVNQALKEIAK